MARREVTYLLADGHPPNRVHADQLLALVYDQLRKIAQEKLNRERRSHTLQATALVHEAYLRLIGDPYFDWRSLAHFFAAAAEAMRRILIEHARKHGALKRGGGLKTVGSVLDLASDEKISEALALDELISRLTQEDPQAGQIVRLRFFTGLSIDETATALGVSPRTVKRHWEYARAWLADALKG